MALELENINNIIADDLDLRNRNWGAIDTSLAGKADLSEIEVARGAEATLGARLDSTDAQLNETANNLVEHKLEYAQQNYDFMTINKNASNIYSLPISENIPLKFIITGDTINGDNTTISKIKTTGINIFDKTKAMLNHNIGTTTGNINPGTGNFVSEYILIEKFHTYARTRTNHDQERTAFYDKDKVLISIITSYAPTEIIPPENAVYFLVSGRMTDIDTFIINVGETLLPYEPYIENVIVLDVPITLSQGQTLSSESLPILNPIKNGHFMLDSVVTPNVNLTIFSNKIMKNYMVDEINNKRYKYGLKADGENVIFIYEEV